MHSFPGFVVILRMEHLMLFFYVSYSVFKGDFALKMWKSMGRNIAAGFGDDASIQSFGQVSWEVCQYIPYSAHDRFHGMNH